MNWKSGAVEKSTPTRERVCRVLLGGIQGGYKSVSSTRKLNGNRPFSNWSVKDVILVDLAMNPRRRSRSGPEVVTSSPFLKPFLIRRFTYFRSVMV